MNICLIGMPGSGKSFVGKLLAQRLGFSFLGIDPLIENEYGLPLQKIVEKLGSETFLDIEAARIVEHCKDINHAVISPGGSVVYRESAMLFLQKVSKIVYLQVPIEILETRVGVSPRGIVNDGNKSLQDLYTERTPLYKKWAQVVIDGSRDAEEVASQIIKEIHAERLV